jgi:hypothetical protein
LPLVIEGRAGDDVLVGGSGRDSPYDGPGDEILIDFSGRNHYYKGFAVCGDGATTVCALAPWASEFVSCLARTRDANPNRDIQAMLNFDVET